MSSSHVHIASDAGHGIVYIGEDGRAHGDGSSVAEFVIHEINHRGLGPEHGLKLLDSIVHRLDPATHMSARRCHKSECLTHLSR